MPAWSIAAVAVVAAAAGGFWAGIAFQTRTCLRMIRDGDFDQAVAICRQKRERDVPAR